MNFPPLNSSDHIPSQSRAGHSLSHLLPDAGPADTRKKDQYIRDWRQLVWRCQVRVEVEKGLDLARDKQMRSEMGAV